MTETLYTQGRKLLYSEYYLNYEIVKDSPFHKSYVNEKIRHSLQVSGAGNGILRNEAYFQDKSAHFLDIAKTAILLHDIYRFKEIRLMFETGEKIDHGAKGAEFLKDYPEFNSIYITLPIKHHGHMVEDFYADPEYLSIEDESVKKDVEQILFAVRDADKIANWQNLANELSGTEPLWLPYPDDKSEKQSVVSEQIMSYFTRDEVVPHRYIETNADQIVSILCWLFDINYWYSVIYCQRLNLAAKILRILEAMHVKSEMLNRIENTISQFALKKFNVKL